SNQAASASPLAATSLHQALDARDDSVLERTGHHCPRRTSTSMAFHAMSRPATHGELSLELIESRAVQILTQRLLGKPDVLLDVASRTSLKIGDLGDAESFGQAQDQGLPLITRQLGERFGQ